MSPMSPVSYWMELLRRAFERRNWLCVSDHAVPSAREAQALLELGAHSVRVVAGSRGTGPLPEGIEVRTPGVQASELMEAIRASERALRALPAEVCEWLDVWDPQRSARVIQAPFGGPGPIAGRAIYGGRRAEWIAWDDKTRAETLWRATDTPHAPAAVVSPAAAERAAAELDWGAGTVWAADNQRGWHGGATRLRWVRTAEDAREARAFFGAVSERVRVMPFLEGVPCSVHGIALQDRVVALRPCEMLVFRQSDPGHPDASRFQYAGSGTYWDPPDADREAMRASVRRVGAWLREQLGFRGVFTIDGVLSERGFLPTEINPRFGAALGVVAGGTGIPLYLLHLAIVEDEPCDWRAAELEDALLECADRNRSARIGLSSPARRDPAQLRLVAGDGVREAREAEPHDVELTLGPSSSGSYLGIAFVPGRTPVGPSLARGAAAILRWASQRFELGLSAVEGARDVRA